MLYKKCFDVSVVLTLKLVRLFKKKSLRKQKKNSTKNYFSFPSKKEIKKI